MKIVGNAVTLLLTNGSMGLDLAYYFNQRVNSREKVRKGMSATLAHALSFEERCVHNDPHCAKMKRHARSALERPMLLCRMPHSLSNYLILFELLVQP